MGSVIRKGRALLTSPRIDVVGPLVTLALQKIMRGAIRSWIVSLDFSDKLHQPSPGAEVKSGIRATSGNGSGSIAQLQQILPHLAESTVLDLGSNSGFYAYELARAGYHVTGVEPDPLLNKVAMSIRVLHPDLDFSSVPDVFPGARGLAKSYDNVLCLSVFQQWARQMGFDPARKVLRNAARLAATTFFRDAQHLYERESLELAAGYGRKFVRLQRVD